MAKPFQESYIDVERAYSQGQFLEALTQAETLLKDRPEDADDLPYSRLQLLIGHINLYGLKRHAAAARSYLQVVESSQETTYRDLARQGLELCASEEAKATAPAEVAHDREPEAEGASAEAPFQSAAAIGQGTIVQGGGRQAAMPWLTDEPSPVAPTEPQVFADPFKVQESSFTPAGPELTLEPEPELADDAIIEAKVLDEASTPSPSEPPQELPSSFFSAEELAQLAKGRLRVILR